MIISGRSYLKLNTKLIGEKAFDTLINIVIEMQTIICCLESRFFIKEFIDKYFLRTLCEIDGLEQLAF